MPTPSRLSTELARARFPHEAVGQRLGEEIAFAEQLLDLHPEYADAWRPRLADAAREAVQAARGDAASLLSAAERIEAGLSGLGGLAKSYVVHAAGHAHIDMNWMWGWPETVAITLDTFRTILRLLEEYPEFHFSQSQASCYRIAEEYDPALFEAIRARVAEGRWEVTASHWVENDSNMAGPFALAQHLFQTREYFREKFGLAPADVPVNWAPDTFGHAAQTPTYLAAGGVKYQYLHRPGVNTPRPRLAFWWEAPSGARTLVFNAENIGYNSRLEPGLRRPLVQFARETGLRRWLVSYGIGDHGGGPTRRDLAFVREMNQWPIFPRFELGRVKDYFEWLDENGAELPVIQGELNTEFTGCYTTQTSIKRNNRIAENRLADASLAGALVGGALSRVNAAPDWPFERMRRAWRDILFGHFHDILPGSCVHDTRTYQHGLAQSAMADANTAEVRVLRAFAARVKPLASSAPVAEAAGAQATPALFLNDSLGGGVGFGLGGIDGLSGTVHQPNPEGQRAVADGVRPHVAYNFTGHDREEVIEVTVWENAAVQVPRAFHERSFVIRRADRPDQTLFAQKTAHGHYWGHRFVTLAFPARVPALGYAAFTVEEAGQDAAWPAESVRARSIGHVTNCAYAPGQGGKEGLENEFLRVWIDHRTGSIKSLVDSRTGQTLVAAPGRPALEFFRETPHRMSAWTLGYPGALEPVRVTNIKRRQEGEGGPWKAALDVSLRLGASDFVLTYELRAGDPGLRVKLKGTWFERGSAEEGIPALRWRMSGTLEQAKASYEIPFGSLERPYHEGEEQPGLEWAALTGQTPDGKPAGLALANDSKYGYSLDGRDLTLTLIRSSCDPDVLPEIGRHEVNWRIEPFAGPLAPEAVHRSARALNHALRATAADALSMPAEGGACASVGRFAFCAGGELFGVEALPDTEEILFLVYEPAGRPATLRLDFTDSPLGRVTTARVGGLNLREETAPVAVKGNIVETPISAYGIVSLFVSFKDQSGPAGQGRADRP